MFGDGEQARDFVFVDDVVRANMLASTAPEAAWGRAFNIGRGERRTVNELLATIRSLIPGDHPDPIHAPPRPGEIRDSWSDIGAALEGLGYRPAVTFEEGLRRTIEWIAGREGWSRLEELGRARAPDSAPDRCHRRYHRHGGAAAGAAAAGPAVRRRRSRRRHPPPVPPPCGVPPPPVPPPAPPPARRRYTADAAVATAAATAVATAGPPPVPPPVPPRPAAGPAACRRRRCHRRRHRSRRRRRRRSRRRPPPPLPRRRCPAGAAAVATAVRRRCRRHRRRHRSVPPVCHCRATACPGALVISTTARARRVFGGGLVALRRFAGGRCRVFGARGRLRPRGPDRACTGLVLRAVDGRDRRGAVGSL